MSIMKDDNGGHNKKDNNTNTNKSNNDDNKMAITGTRIRTLKKDNGYMLITLNHSQD